MSHRTETIENHHAGNSRFLKVQVREPPQSDNEEFGDPVDVRQAEVEYALIEYDEENEEPLDKCKFIKTTSDGITITDGLNGRVEVKWEPSDTEGLGGTYYHQMEFTDVDDDVSTVFTGTVEIIESINC